MIEETTVLTYVHDRGDNIPLTHLHDRGDNSLNICT